MGKLPNKWKPYSCCGKPLSVAPIIAFKTPLAVEYKQEFTPDYLVKYITELGYEFVVVVDLTNTYRYYDGREEFTEKYNIQYEKIECEGKRIPKDIIMESVATVIDNVIHVYGRNSKKLVGIHCTHGINRTGYLIARYLIEWLGYEPEDAIHLVAEARGYKIQREPYLNDLRKRMPGGRFAALEKEHCALKTGNAPMNLCASYAGNEIENEHFEPNVINIDTYVTTVCKGNDLHSNQCTTGQIQQEDFKPADVCDALVDNWVDEDVDDDYIIFKDCWDDEEEEEKKVTVSTKEEEDTDRKGEREGREEKEGSFGQASRDEQN